MKTKLSTEIKKSCSSSLKGQFIKKEYEREKVLIIYYRIIESI